MQSASSPICRTDLLLDFYTIKASSTTQEAAFISRIALSVVSFRNVTRCWLNAWTDKRLRTAYLLAFLASTAIAHSAFCPSRTAARRVLCKTHLIALHRTLVVSLTLLGHRLIQHIEGLLLKLAVLTLTAATRDA